ncbi:MAG: Gldg family protein, partial [Prevotellaceae bacterium]|nr:Gldg family protein [Prevotellaceae bacterium]
VCLLQPDGQRNGENGINRAIENLEFQFTDAIRILNKKKVEKIAFLEGHGELSEELVYDVSEAFSRYFQIDRGVIGLDASILDDYKAIVIAKPKKPFSESDKYIIDQYIMNGGRVLWLIDGVQIQESDLTQRGVAPMLPLDVNLQDQLFRYGVRITSTLVQDAQCAYMPMNIAKPGETPQFEPLPWFYTPLLLPSPISPITKNLMQVKADFASVLDFTSDENKVQKDLLLITSNATHVSQAPATIDLSQLLENSKQDGYFFTKYQPIAASLQGVFPSNFPSRGRMVPAGIVSEKPHRDESVPTRMIVVADGDIIRNEVENSAQGIHIIPAGYDRASHMTFGNKDFLLNALLYLTDDQDWLSLRNRTFKLHLLNKTAVNTNRHFWQWSNILLPLALLAIFGVMHFVVRRKRFEKG